MKKFNLLIIFSLLISIFLGFPFLLSFPVTCSDFAPTTAQQTTIRVGAYHNPPKVFMDTTGGYTGFFPVILDYIAEQEGWTIEWVTCTWDDCLESLESNDIDVMVDVAYSDERATLYEFNDVSVMENWGTIYSQEDVQINLFTELEGLTVAVMQGGIHYIGPEGINKSLSDLNVNATFLELGSYADVFEAIENGSADVGVVNRLFGRHNENDYAVRRTSLFFNPINLHFAFTLNGELNEEIIPRIDFHLIEMKDDIDSIYYSALEEYILGVVEVQRIPDWVLWVLGIIAVLTISFFSMSVLLKKRVDARTSDLSQALENLEVNSQVLIETIPTGVIALDSEGKITLLNQIFIQIYKAAYEQELSVEMKLLKRESNELVENLQNILQGTEASQNHGKPNSKIISLPNNQHFEVFYAPLAETAHHLKSGVIFIFYNITPFIEVEQLRKQFISTVSHELRTPIASINLTLENLITYKEKISEEKKDYMLGLMVKSGKVLAEMIEDLLITSRIEGKRITLNKKPSDLIALIDEVIAQLAGKIEEKNITIKKVGLDRCPSVVDPIRIEQVFRIILDNAVKYTPEESEVLVRIDGNSPHTIRGNEYEGILVEIRDKGLGIPEKDQAKLFTRFYRASNVRSIGGTGLGLTIARDLVELHEGQIILDSKEGKGTTVYLLFPN